MVIEFQIISQIFRRHLREIENLKPLIANSGPRIYRETVALTVVIIMKRIPNMKSIYASSVYRILKEKQINAPYFHMCIQDLQPRGFQTFLKKNLKR